MHADSKREEAKSSSIGGTDNSEQVDCALDDGPDASQKREPDEVASQRHAVVFLVGTNWQALKVVGS